MTDAMAVVAEYLYRGEAEIARAMLDSAGIAALVRADDEGGLNPGFFSEFRVSLVVNDADLDAARAVLGRRASLVVPEEARRAMRSHMAWAAPLEACGLLAGAAADRVDLVFCLTNRAASPARYLIDPREHYGAAGYAESCGYEIIGAWHSHPQGSAALSATDIASSPGGDWLTVVVGADGAVGAYRVRRGDVEQVPVVADEPAGGPMPSLR